MAEVALSGAKLVEEIDATQAPFGALAFWWLGQNGFAFKGGDTVVYTDLYLSDPDGGKRQTAPPLTPEEVSNAAVVACSHDHSDHLDPGAVPGIAKASLQATFVFPRAATQRMEALGVNAKRRVPLSHNETVRLGDLTITALKSKHEFFEEDAELGFPYLGFVYQLNGFTWYHAGDTVPWDGLAASLKAHRPDALFLPINGRDAERYRRNCLGNCTFQEAVDLAGAVGSPVAVPMHWDMFAANSEDPQRFIDYLQAKFPRIDTWVGRAGERVILSRDGARECSSERRSV